MREIPAGLQRLWQKMLAWTSTSLRAAGDAFISFVPMLTAIAALLLVVAVAGIAIRIHRDHVFHGATLSSVDAMEGTRFEEFLAELFSHLGYRIQLVGNSHDFGADLVLTSRRQRIVVQAKRYGGSVGIAAVQEVLGAVQYYHGTRGMVVTNSGFTESARELAARSGVDLWDRQRLASAMARTTGRRAVPERNRPGIETRSEP
ncbi:MAG: restriction endonuclease [Candidatus Cryosericum sp.]